MSNALGAGNLCSIYEAARLLLAQSWRLGSEGLEALFGLIAQGGGFSLVEVLLQVT
jgi:hypothetical protein